MINSAIYPVPSEFHLLPPRQLILFLLFLLNSHPFCLSLLVYIVYNYGTSELEETVGGISLMKKHGFKSDM